MKHDTKLWFIYHKEIKFMSPRNPVRWNIIPYNRFSVPHTQKTVMSFERSEGFCKHVIRSQSSAYQPASRFLGWIRVNALPRRIIGEIGYKVWARRIATSKYYLSSI